MKHLITLGSLLFVLAVTVLTPAVQAFEPDSVSTRQAQSCKEMKHQNNVRCAELEEQILGTTVRFIFETWIVAPNETGYEIHNSVGHATVRDGRYLVTHNHFETPLSIYQQEGESDLYTRVYLFDAAGELRYDGSLSDFYILLEDDETMILAHGVEGFFESLGFRSAQFKGWDPSLLEAGAEVARIDWDGERTYVDWTSVRDHSFEKGVAQIILEDGIMVGASGGGIFWQGYHIANNWLLVLMLDGRGLVIDQSTTAALNSALVIGEPSSQ